MVKMLMDDAKDSQALGRQRQVALCELQVSLVYIMSTELATVT